MEINIPNLERHELAASRERLIGFGMRSGMDPTTSREVRRSSSTHSEPSSSSLERLHRNLGMAGRVHAQTRGAGSQSSVPVARRGLTHDAFRDPLATRRATTIRGRIYEVTAIVAHFPRGL